MEKRLSFRFNKTIIRKKKINLDFKAIEKKIDNEIENAFNFAFKSKFPPKSYIKKFIYS